MSEYSKEPSFKETANSLITEFALALTALRDGIYYPSGTAIVIAPYLALTAKHVIEDYWQRFETGQMRDGGHGEFSVRAVQILDEGKGGALWEVTKMWLSPLTDIAFLRLNPRSIRAEKHKWRGVGLSLLPPPVGARLAGFGYHSSEIKLEKLEDFAQVIWRHSPTTAVGEVIEVHNLYRDSTRLNFPCYQTNARFDGGMSGGPVFNDNGKLCGIICSNLPPVNDTEEHISYVTTLWPCMATIIDLNREGYTPDEKYPVLDLARDGLLKAEGWERLFYVKDKITANVQFGLKPE